MTELQPNECIVLRGAATVLHGGVGFAGSLLITDRRIIVEPDPLVALTGEVPWIVELVNIARVTRSSALIHAGVAGAAIEIVLLDGSVRTLVPLLGSDSDTVLAELERRVDSARQRMSAEAVAHASDPSTLETGRSWGQGAKALAHAIAYVLPAVLLALILAFRPVGAFPGFYLLILCSSLTGFGAMRMMRRDNAVAAQRAAIQSQDAEPDRSGSAV